MALKQRVLQLEQSLNINSSATPSPVTVSSGDNNTYYMKITLNESGVLEFRAAAGTQFGPPEISVKITNNASSFNQSTGWPQLNDVIGSTPQSVTIRGQTATLVCSFEFNAGTYYVYWRNESNTADSVSVSVKLSAAALWTEVVNSIGEITSIYEPPTPISASAYTLYCYYVKFRQDGLCKFESTVIGNVRLYVADGTDYTFDDQAGTISGNDVVVSTFSKSATFQAYAGRSYRFWIRNQNGYSTDELNFRIIPPGELWSVISYDSLKTVTEEGLSYSSIPGSIFAKKNIYYIPLKFNPVAKYQFAGQSSISYDIYLTSSISIDSEGIPTDILGYGRTVTNFTFDYVPRGPQVTYYLMIRTPDGEPPGSYSLSIDITYLEAIRYWFLDAEVIGTRTEQYVLVNDYNQLYTVYKKTIRFTQSGLISFYSKASQNYGVDPTYPKAWITRHTDSFDNVNGAPPEDVDIIGSDLNPDGNRQFSIMVNVVAGIDYDFWFRLCDGTITGIGRIYIDVPGGNGPSGTWHYTQMSRLRDVSSSTTVEIALTPAYGKYFEITFAATGDVQITLPNDANAFLFCSRNTGYDSASGIPNNPLDESGGLSMTISVTASFTYYIWVRGSTTNIQATYNLIITPIQWQAVTMSGSPFSIASSSVRSQFSLAEGSMYLAEVTFSSSGEANFYSNDGNTRLAWLTDSNSGITPSTGIPLGTILASDTRGSGNFGFVYNVTAGVTYYFWVRSNVFRDTTALDLYFAPPGSAATSKGFWICTAVSPSIEWTKVRVYVCTSENPVTWGLVEHPSICVEEGQNPEWVIGT